MVPFQPDLAVRLYWIKVVIHIQQAAGPWPRTLHTGCDFFFKYSDRILFSTDLALELELYRLHFRFLETADQYFEYPSHASRQGKVEYL
jgi:hypothetical protein